MAHSITDAEGKLHKIAGNFNPSYDVSQLVAEKTITTATTLIEINNLDINRDGGVYDFILITSNTAPQASNMHITINNYNLSRYFSEICDFNNNSMASSQLFGVGSGYLGVISQNNGFSIGSITLMKNMPLYEIRNFSLQATARTVTVNGGYYENTSNITSIQFMTDYGFTAGTTVKIYKRMANVTAGNSGSSPTYKIIGHIQNPSNGSVVNLNDKISNFDEIMTIMINTSDGWYNYNYVPAFEVLNRNVQNSRIVQMIGSGVYVNYYSNGDNQLVLPYVSGTTHFYIYGVKY